MICADSLKVLLICVAMFGFKEESEDIAIHYMVLSHKWMRCGD
jgi:hypothetical protein